MILDLLVLIAGAISVAMAIIVLAKGTNTKSMRLAYGMFASSVGLWAVFLGLFLLTTSSLWGNVFVFSYYSLGLFIPYAFLLFSLAYLSMRVSRLVQAIALLPWFVLSAIIAIPGGMINSVNVDASTVELSGPMYFLYSLTFILYTAIGLWLLFTKSKRIKSTQRHRRIVAGSLLVGFAGGGYFDIVLPLLGDYSQIAYGPLFAFITSAGIFYVIARHGLFDIRLAVVRTIAYTMSIATLAAVYLLVAFFVFDSLLDEGASQGAMVLNISLTLVLAFIFQPVRRFFDKITNRIFYRDEYDVEEFYANHNRALSSTADLRRLLERSAEEINNALKAEQVFFFVQYGDGRFISDGTENHSRMARKDIDSLDEYIAETKASAVLTDFLTDAPNIKRLLTSYRIALLIPLTHEENIIGYICLGEKKVGMYAKRDIQTLLTITDGLIIAIQNALAVREIKDLNETLQQRITAATKELRSSNAQLIKLDEAKDEFVSMASHQLRTPLTSIKGYISMMLEGDAGKINNTQKHFLREAFSSSERMVRLVNDFLNVSRLQTGRFMIDKKPTNLADVVTEELASLESSADSRNLEFVFKAPKNIPTLNLDEDKIRQVIMNFVDNAMFYSPEGSKIYINLVNKDDMVELTVKDQGIGVPKSEQSKLFTKFYRASNARKQRPDGTGVGLFLAKKVINDHGGDVMFESTEGKGSTFGFKLPVHQLLGSSDSDNLKDKPNDN